ncbi:MAG: hypothetical protein ABW136_03280 [Steroidobacteraceae bacterium]
MRIPLLIAIGLTAAAGLQAAEPARKSEPASASGETARKAPDWQAAARQQAQAEAKTPATEAAIRRAASDDPETGIDSVEVVGVDDGLPKRGDSQRIGRGTPITWIDNNCFYESPPSFLEPGALTRLWMPQCKASSARSIGLGRTPKQPTRLVDDSVPAIPQPILLREPAPATSR